MIFQQAIILYCKEHKIKSPQFAARTGISAKAARNFLAGIELRQENFAKILSWALAHEALEITRLVGQPDNRS
ncbi:MAG TPA: hypothetical protein VFV38_31365 [Ktedonobacteraceae bacterium]|nr:hypothetical protein [Ktedonobacteraceae bacterium]